MRKLKLLKLILSVLFLLLIQVSVFSETKINVFVSILPQKYFVNNLAGKWVNTYALVKPGQSPATYQPSPGQIAKLARAKILFTIGVPFEKHLLKKIKSICPKLKIIPTDVNIKKRKIHTPTLNNVSYKVSKAENLDPHIWLDPILMKSQVSIMAKALAEELPKHKKEILRNLQKLLIKLTNLSNKIAKRLKPLKGKILFTFHPAFGYFTDRYGLIQQSIEIEGKEPVPAQVAKLMGKCKSEKIRVIFAEKQFASNAVKAIADFINGKIIYIDPLSADYFKNLTDFSKLIVENLSD